MRTVVVDAQPDAVQPRPGLGHRRGRPRPLRQHERADLHAHRLHGDSDLRGQGPRPYVPEIVAEFGAEVELRGDSVDDGFSTYRRALAGAQGGGVDAGAVPELGRRAAHVVHAGQCGVRDARRRNDRGTMVGSN